ncbi:MAG: riboflavin synthase [Chloroflexia bacterium]
MFSGIVEELGTVREIRIGRSRRAGVRCERAVEDARVGDSIAVNGACLTVERCDPGLFTVGVMPETLRCTNLGALQPGDRVNLERSLAATGRVGGHFVQGHVDDTGEVLGLRSDGAALVVKIALPPRLARYVVTKGYISVDGSSLTVMVATPAWFTVSLVYHTQEHTTLAMKRPAAQSTWR